MRILFIVRSLGYGGASKQLVLTAEALAERGHEVYVYSYNADHSDLQFSKVVFIPERNMEKSSLKEYISSPIRIRKQIKRLNPDIVISWRANAGCFCTLACLGLKVKHVFSERTDPYMETNLLLKVATKICDYADNGVFQTEGAKRYYKRLDKSRSTVIPNPIIFNHEVKLVPYNERRNEIAFVGRCFLKQKRQDIMLKAFKIVLETHPEMHLKFYGGDFDIEKIKCMVSDMELQEHVTFAGPVNDVLNKIKYARVLALSSDYEGIPNVLLEAMSVGVPVVSTDTSPGGVRVVVNDGENGYIVPRGDYKKLAEKILMVLNKKDIAEKFVQNGFANIKRFNPELIFEQWNRYLNGIVK